MMGQRVYNFVFQRRDSRVEGDDAKGRHGSLNLPVNPAPLQRLFHRSLFCQSFSRLLDALARRG